MIYAPRLPRLGTFTAWRDAARALASNGIPPQDITWGMEGGQSALFDGGAELPPAQQMTVPQAFVPLAKLVCASRAPHAPDLLYRVLLRCRGNARLLGNRADPDIQRLETLAKNIRRDMHKMKAFVRFRDVTPQGANRRRFLSWFEPDHRIEELIAPFFARRFGDMDWAIVTPEITTRFEGGDLHHQAVASTRLELSDETEELWRTYYANIFNPARLKIKAMQSEMPKKYWKNLPEAALIPGLIAGAQARGQQMQADAPSLPPLRAGRILQRLPERDQAPDDLHACARCPIATNATQAVAGVGPQDARLMIVGEQPGAKEDLAGLPFVGPAGQLLDEIAAQVGLDRARVYMTNAVKHFKFAPRGGQRIHQSPDASEIDACRVWLGREIAQIQPVLILALGATAARSLTGDGANLSARCGQVERSIEGVPVLITLHPAAVLRAGNPAQMQMRDILRRDMAAALHMVAQAAAL